MTPEAIYVSRETKSRLIREANEAEMTLDEYIANRAGSRASPQSNGGSTSYTPSADGRPRSKWSERMEDMQDIYMARALAMGQPPNAMMGDQSSPALERLAQRLERIEERLENRPATPPADDLGIDQILRQSIRYRAMAPILKTIGGEDSEGSGSKAQRAYEAEMRAKVEKVQDQMLAEIRAKDREISGIKDAQTEARLADYKATVDSLRDEIGGLSDQIRTGPTAQQGTVVDQLTAALNQATQVQSALEQLANRNRPAAPTPTGERDTVQTIAYLANELSGAVSKGLEAVARVNAANRGHNPDAIGRMPAPGSPPPSYQPAYVEAPAAAAPAAPAAPARHIRANPAPQSTRMGPGSRLIFEGANRPVSGPATAMQGQSTAMPLPGATPDVLPPLPPLDPRVESYMGPNNEPITAEQYQQLREVIYQRTGRDPAQLFTQDGRPASAPTPEQDGAFSEDVSGDPNAAEGPPDSSA